MTERQQLRSYDPISEVSSTSITPVEYSGLQMAYDHFNVILFDGSLVDVFITYQRHAHSRGYFSPDRFSGRDDVSGRHELALNPDGFVGRTDEQICSTLVHEMVHVWHLFADRLADARKALARIGEFVRAHIGP